jgi:hypothetical protein
MPIFYILIAYLIPVFILSRFVIPHLSIGSDPLPETIPDGMRREIEKLKDLSGGLKRRYLELAFEFVGSRYHSERLGTITEFFQFFYPLERIWDKKGFVQCTLSNFVMRIFLVRSGIFEDGEVERAHTFANGVPHQYLKVLLDGRWIDVDVGEKQRGLKIGEHLWGFHFNYKIRDEAGKPACGLDGMC